MPPVRQVVDEGGESVADMREVAPDLRTVIHENRHLHRHIRQLRTEHVAALSILLDDELVGRQVEHRLAAADHAHGTPTAPGPAPAESHPAPFPRR